MNIDEARKFFSKDLYATSVTGIVIDEVSQNYAKVSLKLQDKHRNAVGAVMGGVVYTLADFAFAVATNFDGNITVTLSASISYLTGTKGDVLYAETKLIKDGRRNCFYEVYITDNTGASIAVVNMCGAHI